jgi:hypothetical protein
MRGWRSRIGEGRLASDPQSSVARQTGWEGSDNQDEKPSVAAQA